MQKPQYTKTFEKKLKKAAKALCKASPDLSYQQALNVLAQQAGEKHWNLVRSKSAQPCDTVVKNDPLAKKYGFNDWDDMAAHLLEPNMHDGNVYAYYMQLPEIILRKVLESPRLRRTQGVQESSTMYEEACWDVWNNGYPEAGREGYSRHLYLSTGLATDWIMEVGNSLFDNNDALSPLVESTIWIATADFWRSIYEATGDGRKRHPGFNGYMRDWVAGMGEKLRKAPQPDQKSQQALNLLEKLYLRPDILMIPPGIAHWGAGFLGEFEGRPALTD